MTTSSALTASLTLARRTLALAIALGVALAVMQFPLSQPTIGAGLLLYAALLYRFPWIWLWVIPAVLPVIDLALWSGRFFFDEFDFLTLTTLALLYWRRPAGRIFPGVFARPYLPVTLLALSYAAGTALALYPLPPLDANSFSTYLSPYNALRVAKGFLWAWLLMPFLLSEMDKNFTLTRHRLITGIMIGLGLAGICALWERGIFIDILWARNIYAILGGLLDFTGSYRITGMFSGMNVGDTAIDGYLALAVPLALYPVFYAKSPWARLAGLGIFSLGGYALIVTFSRGLYAAFGLALLIILIALIFGQRRKLMDHLGETTLLIAGFALATYLLFHLYVAGGYEALVLGVAAVVAAGLAGSQLKAGGLILQVPLWIAGGGAVGAMIHRAIGHHKWSTSAPELALGLSIAAAILLFVLPAVAAHKRARDLNLSTRIIAALLLAVFWMGVIPPLSGVRVLSRFSTSSADLETRKTHWRDSLAAMEDDWTHRISGMGVGSFPRYYFSSQLGSTQKDKIPLASYRFERGPTGAYMTLGSGDFNMIQRIRLKPDTVYKLKLDIRTGPQKGGVTVKLCHKHILYSERYTPDCKEVSFRTQTGNQWLTDDITLNSGKLGRYGIFYWPTTFMLQNGGSANIDLANISLTAPDGQNLINNGNFAAGGDRWVLISDFEHLAWHAKNMFLHLYFEQGIIGLAFFLILTAAALNRLRLNHQSGDRTAIFWTASICAFLAVGLFGTSLDMPRVASLFYLILFASLAPARGFLPPQQVTK